MEGFCGRVAVSVGSVNAASGAISSIVDRWASCGGLRGVDDVKVEQCVCLEEMRALFDWRIVR